MDANTSRGIYNTDLQLAVRHLYGKGKINSDGDIVKATGYGKSTVSGYIKGKIKASNDFRTKFESAFELNLSDFHDDQKVEDSNKIPKVEDKYVALLEKTLEEKEADLVALRSAVNGISDVKKRIDILEPIVNDLKDKVGGDISNIEVLREWLIDQFSKLKKESPQSVAASMGRMRAELLKKDKQQGTRVG